MSTSQDWIEEDSTDFVEFGDYFVPNRQTQIDTVLSLIPPPDAPVEMLDLCCGPGLLSKGLLEAFPQATVVGLDLSPVMLETARRELSGFGERFAAERFDLGGRSWRSRPVAPAAVVSSLAVHHLDGEQKQALFRDVHRLLRPGGVLVLADLVQPVGARGLALAREGWNTAVRERSLARHQSLTPYEKFHELEWSCYEYPDELDKPSPLPDQLRWLTEAGFDEVDVYWMRAGHAVYGGVKAEGRR
ncbi:class I SAM-dependent methyltransferase [Streptomyces profundus]|uniref:class I SAM-dependent methyltransferase n=1 Tax=Streptomyces profundus TaxID=2867410 RepID=UPI001D16BF5E|nr:class I SAM-dependent methyltransferase [Streptomyces sp. MA3_2.13]UED86560.1 class I SAM-dependent methyltransferase [Streptomyces sp. MA3_2.13]